MDEERLIYRYTSDQATADGILLDIRVLNPEWVEKSLVMHITMNLLHKHGYIETITEKLIPNLYDLLSQALELMKRQTANFTTTPEVHYEGEIEAPNGEQLTIWMNMNEIEEMHQDIPYYYQKITRQKEKYDN